jgi:hypothetical protein
MATDAAFAMHGARAAVAGGMTHIEEQVKALELAVVQNTGLAFDLAKTLIESACKTIITERGATFDKDDELPRLFKQATQSMPFLPPSMSTDAAARKSLLQTLSGLSAAVHGVCELRNSFGFASHGDDAPRPAMEGAQALLAAQAADAIIGFLHRVHRQDVSRPRSIRLVYEDNPELNEWIDQQNPPIQILALPAYKPSEVIFSVDEEAYRDLLANYKSDLEDEHEPEAAAGKTGVQQ